MGEQQRMATARAIVVQETATALVATMDERRDRLFVEDGAMAMGLALATFVSVNASSPEHEQELLGRVVVTAQAGVKAAKREQAS